MDDLLKDMIDDEEDTEIEYENCTIKAGKDE